MVPCFIRGQSRRLKLLAAPTGEVQMNVLAGDDDRAYRRAQEWVDGEGLTESWTAYYEAKSRAARLLEDTGYAYRAWYCRRDKGPLVVRQAPREHRPRQHDLLEARFAPGEAVTAVGIFDATREGIAAGSKGLRVLKGTPESIASRLRLRLIFFIGLALSIALGWSLVLWYWLGEYLALAIAELA